MKLRRKRTVTSTRDRKLAKLSVIVSCLMLAPFAATVADGQPLAQVSLEDALSLALARNATLRAKEAELNSVKANEITAGLRPNPTASYLVEQIGLSNTTPQHTATLGQPIETGGKRRRRIESAQAATRTTGYELADVRRLTAFQVKKAFTDILVAQSTLGLASENLKTLDELERLQRLRAERGDISELELTRIQVQRYAFERDAADARLAAKTAKLALRALVDPAAVAEEFSVIGELTFHEVPLARPDLYRLTFANRPDLRAAEAARDKARADFNLARANAWWDITPQVEYQRIGPDNTLGFGVSLPIRIFDRNQGEIARTRSEIDRTDRVREAVVIQALLEADTALATALNEREKLRLLRETYLRKAQEARDTVDYAYRRGGLTLLDFLDAQRTYRETALQHITALGNYETALVQLEAAVGGSLE